MITFPIYLAIGLIPAIWLVRKFWRENAEPHQAQFFSNKMIYRDDPSSLLFMLIILVFLPVVYGVAVVGLLVALALKILSCWIKKLQGQDVRIWDDVGVSVAKFFGPWDQL